MRIHKIDWLPVGRIQFGSWLLFYGVLLLFLAIHFSQPTLLDNVHLVTHEAGHLLFGWFGQTIGLWGGTLLQLLVPALLFIAFVIRAEIPGVVFCSFAFFHSLTGVATYMIDALRLELPLVTVGAVADEADHDWVRIFTQMGVLPDAIQIGTIVRIIAWLGMLGTLAWFCWQFFRQHREPA